jgi:hypothetical protein
MRIATWNLNRCSFGSSARCAKLLEWMERVDADIWVLTETHQTFAPRSGYRLIAHSADAPDRKFGRGECWVAVWSRLSAVPISLSANLERVAAAKVGEAVIVGTVLPWLADGRQPGLRGEAAFRARRRSRRPIGRGSGINRAAFVWPAPSTKTYSHQATTTVRPPDVERCGRPYRT